MNPMSYKGYAARIKYSDEDGLSSGTSLASATWSAFMASP